MYTITLLLNILGFIIYQYVACVSVVALVTTLYLIPILFIHVLAVIFGRIFDRNVIINFISILLCIVCFIVFTYCVFNLH